MVKPVWKLAHVIPRVWERYGKYLVPALMACLITFLILGPLLARGYVFFLDFVFPPIYPINLESLKESRSLLSSLPYHVVVSFLATFFPTDIVQKFILVIIFVAGWLGAWVSLPASLHRGVRLIASTFYIINPFVYERFMAGHVLILLGYAAFPLMIRAWQRAFILPAGRHITVAVLLWTLQIIFSTHYVIIGGMTIGILWIAATVQFWQAKSGILPLLRWREWILRGPGRTVVIAGVLFIVCNSFWLVPALVGWNRPFLDQISPQHSVSYRTSADPEYGLLMNLFGLYGFWRERTAGDEIILAKDHLPAWPLFLFVLIIPMMNGLAHLWRRERGLAVTMVLLGLTSVWFSVGPQLFVIGVVNRWMFDHIPGFFGLRESQKFLAMLPWVYTVFLAYGLNAWFFRYSRQWQRWVVGLGMVMVIALYTFPIFWGAWGKIQTHQYPASFAYTKKHLALRDDEGRLLALPWHQYLIGHPLGDGRTIADPLAAYMYPYSIVASLDPEVPGVQVPKSKEQLDVEAALRTPSAELWMSLVEAHKIRYIFLTKLTLSPSAGLDEGYYFLLSTKLFPRIFEDEYGVLLGVPPTGG